VATLHRCDQCGYSQETSLPFDVRQATAELDDNDETVTVTYDLCSAQCLADLAMGLSLDFPDDAA
jgi:DsbC/DsbD-like thiol-disulfide interchange protein